LVTFLSSIWGHVVGWSLNDTFTLWGAKRSYLKLIVLQSTVHSYLLLWSHYSHNGLSQNGTLQGTEQSDQTHLFVSGSSTNEICLYKQIHRHTDKQIFHSDIVAPLNMINNCVPVIYMCQRIVILLKALVFHSILWEFLAVPHNPLFLFWRCLTLQPLYAFKYSD